MIASGSDSSAIKPRVIVPVRKAIAFEYTGDRSMIVIGEATGIKYRFSRPGSRVVIDPADLDTFTATPDLKRV